MAPPIPSGNPPPPGVACPAAIHIACPSGRPCVVLIVPLEEANPGMRLAMTVTHPDHPEQDLLRRGYALETPVLARMRDLGIAQVFIEYPGLDDLDKYLAPTLSPQRQAMYARLKSTFNAFQRSAHPTAAFADYQATTRDFIATILDTGRNPIY